MGQARTELAELHSGLFGGAVAPWGVHVTTDIEAPGSGFQASTGGPAYQAIAAAVGEAYGRPMLTLGQGGAIPLCNVLASTYPDAELILLGVEESLARIHAPNESVDPAEIAAHAAKAIADRPRPYQVVADAVLRQQPAHGTSFPPATPPLPWRSRSRSLRSWPGRWPRRGSGMPSWWAGPGCTWGCSIPWTSWPGQASAWP